MLLAGALALYYLSFHDVDLNLADEGFHLALALSVEKTEVTEQSIDRLLKRRLGIVHYMFHRTAGRSDVAVSRMFWVLLRVLLFLMVLAVARRIMPLPAAAVAAMLVAIACGPWHKTWYPFALGLMLYLASRERRGLQTFGVGLVGGVLYTLHPVGMVVGVVLPGFGFLVLERLVTGGRSGWSRLAPAFKYAVNLGAGAAVGAVIFFTANAAVVVLTRGADPGLIWHGPLSILPLVTPGNVAEIVGRTSSWSAHGLLPITALFQHTGGTALGWIPGVVFLLQPLILLAAIRQARLRSASGATGEARLVYLLVALAFANLIKTSVRADLFHVTQAAGPSFILMTYLLWKGGAQLREHWSHTRVGRRVAVAVGLALAITIFPMGYATVVLRSPEQWAASVGSLAHSERRLRLDRSRVYVTRDRAGLLESAVARIQSWTAPDDPILALPFCPMYYFLSGRRCVADDGMFHFPLLAVVPGMQLNARVDRHLAHLLDTHKVKVVVVCPSFASVEDPWSLLPRTKSLLQRQYHRAFEQDGLVLHRRSP